MSARQRVTVEDIARACGLSRATVSLVLRSSPLVHPATRQRVEAEMKRQGYVYNRAAANLRRRVSNSVALVINDLSNPFFAEFATGVDEALGGKDYVTLLGCSNESPQRQLQVLNSLMEHHPAAIILSPAENTDARDIDRVVGGTPLLVFNRMLDHDSDGADHDFLGLDNRGGAMQATAHLIERGHRDIAFFGGHANSSSCQERRQGYHDALKKAGLRARNEWLIESAPTRVDACARSETLFAGKTKPTAAVCYNDAVALGLMLGLAHHGLRPGIDFAVTGFDDIPEAAMSMPELTTLSTDPRARGRQAAQLVLQRVEQATPVSPANIVPVRLVERASSSAPA
ncbi:LacI family DNA-binding transcriptional regulator [Solilutibacter silvestris]|uniref:Transcriptional regulator n=1 Tax=Solilutibacter silvestris TaxID=1645665 RepID=A0A2K1Q107_9GAMM|nr:LacI family DNA-binding transcriptional regulator [Lysobacter silvestris]PNS08728.1 Transcriptional regulator [Lysobacter silvestris]